MTFLGINGVKFDAPEEEVVTKIVMLADGRVSEPELAAWIRSRSAPALA